MSNEDGCIRQMVPITLNLKEAQQLVEKLFGLSVIEIKPLNSYDDKNYHVTVSSSENPSILELWKHGYILKVLNSLDSQNISFVEAQNELMTFLNENDVSTTRPVKNIDGSYHSILEVSLVFGKSLLEDLKERGRNDVSQRYYLDMANPKKICRPSDDATIDDNACQSDAQYAPTKQGMSEEDNPKRKDTSVKTEGVNDEDENKENFDNRRKRRRLKKNGNSRSRSSTDGSSKSSVGYGSGGRHHRSRSTSKRSETIESRMRYGDTEHFVGEKHSTAISSVLDDLKDDILYCQQSELKEIKGKLKTVSDIVSSGEEVYIEGRHGFTPASRSTALRNHSSSMWLEDVAELNYQTPLDLAILVQRLFTPLSTICFGLLGGVALMQSFLSYGYLQSNNKIEDLFMFMESYTIFARVAPTTFYILLAVCIVAVFARFDLAHLDLTHCTDTMFNRQGWFLLIIYLLTLLLTLWSAELDDMLMLYPHDKSFTKNREELYNKLSQWHTLNVCRCIFAMLGWLVISITEPEDLLLQHLKAIKQFDVQPKDILLVSSPSSTARY